MDKGTITRTIILVAVIANQLLVSAGLNPIPGTEDTWGEVITAGITGGVAVWTWFKNNYVTSKGKRQREVLESRGLAKTKGGK